MEVYIDLKKQGLKAIFSVEQETEFIYNLRLKSFSGLNKPPLYLKIRKSTEGWDSAYDDLNLVKEIGLAIDASNI